MSDFQFYDFPKEEKKIEKIQPKPVEKPPVVDMSGGLANVVSQKKKGKKGWAKFNPNSRPDADYGTFFNK